MSQQEDRLEVIDKNGWRKMYPLQKAIIHIGSDLRNDIVLEGGRGSGVNPRHAQLIAGTNHRGGYQLVNLADQPLALDSTGGRTLAPHAVMPVTNGVTFRLGDFTLVFHVGPGAAETRVEPDISAGSAAVISAAPAGRNIGLSLSLPQTLPPYQTVDGLVKVQNLGEQVGVQFELEVLGLEAECYDIEPGPLLPPGAEKAVLFRLHHRGAKPLAGDLQITILATAPRAYFGEEAMISRTIQVLPAYRHRLRLLSPGDSPLLPHAEADFLAPKAKTGPLPRPPQQSASAQQAQPRSATQEWLMGAIPPPPAATPELKLKASTPPARSQPSTPVEPGSTAADLWTAPSGIVLPAGRPDASQPEVSAQALDLWGAAAELSPREKRERLPSRPAISVEADVPPRTRERESSATYAAGTAASKPVEPEPAAAPPLQEVVSDSQPVDAAAAPPITPTESLPAAPVQPITPPPAEEAPPPVETPALSVQPEPAVPPLEPVQPPQPSPQTTEPPAAAEPPLPGESKLKQWWSRFEQWLPFRRAQPVEMPVEPEPAISAPVNLTPESAAGQPAQVEAEPMPSVAAPAITLEEEPLPDRVEEPAEVMAESEFEQPVEAPLPETETGAALQTPAPEIAPPPEQPEPPVVSEIEPETSSPVTEASASPPAVLEIKAEPVTVEPQPALAPAEAAAWWGEEIEAETPPETREKQVLKLKASPAKAREQSSEIELPPEATDWWSAESESSKSAAKR